jgi:hypothetical protein
VFETNLWLYGRSVHNERAAREDEEERPVLYAMQ